MRNRKKSKKGIIIGVTIVAALVSVSAFVYLQAQNRSIEAMGNTATIKTTFLEKTSLINSIAASGTIYSANSQNVYTTQSYPIKEIYVEVGDVVRAGDVLAVLDMTNLDYDIEQAELNLENSKKSLAETQQNINNNIQNSEFSVSSAKLSLEKQQFNYNLLKEKLENGTNNELINAQNTIDSTKLKVDSTERDIEAAENDIKMAEKDVEMAKKEVEIVEKDIETKTEDYNANKELFELGAISQSDLDSVLRTLESAQRSLDSAQKSLDLAQNSLEKTKTARDNAITAHETAVTDYNKAVDTYNRTKSNLQQDLIAAQKDLETSELNYQNSQNALSQNKAKVSNATSSVESQEISLQKLKEQRLEAEIIAPIDGTITAVNATVGSTGSGSSGSGSSGNTLFVVEDMNDLYVSTSIKEFRIGEVVPGQEALVTTDATENQVFKGVLDFVAPTATEASSTSNVEFEIKVRLLEVHPNLKIGMNAYANIILESKEDIYAVEQEAVISNREGGNIVYAVENNVVVEVPVTTGLETDTSVEISGDNLKDGMMLILTTSAVTPGQIIDMEADGASMPVQRGFNPQGEDRGSQGSTPPGEGRSPQGSNPSGEGGSPQGGRTRGNGSPAEAGSSPTRLGGPPSN